jgi:FkbM family methyltransferase
MADWHGQHGEDRAIAGLLGNDANRSDGYWIDCGAWKPTVDSTTLYFSQRGWTGVNIEPVRCFFDEIADARPRDVNLHCAVGEKREPARTIYVGEGTGLSTLLEGFDFQQYPTHTELVEVRTLADICEEFPCPPDRFAAFLKVDAEGFESEIFRGADFSRFRPRVIVAEADKLYPDGTPRYHEWEPILIDAGYCFVHADSANRFYSLADR